jgi:ubiquinone/menaquinone biosynthesis C-methylase UbiE
MDWKIFFDIHKDLPREGSGRGKYTQKAFEMIPKIKEPIILDVGCGPGLQTIKLAKMSDGKIIAIDIHQPFLDQLKKHTINEKLEGRIEIINKSMINMNFSKEKFDIIWAEGSIFIIGFEKGLIEWKSFIKQDGYLAVHEMTWLRDNPPKEISDYWERIYPQIATIEENLEIIKNCGYKLIGYFPLPDDAWWDFYYTPLENRLKTLEIKYKDNSEAMKLIEEHYEEINLYKKYNKWYGSVFYVMQK